MKSFNVLDRGQQVHKSTILEASAGTGKTFAIENIVCRLLIEETNSSPPLQLKEILIVTFTRSSAKDLKMRIRSHLKKALSFLSLFLQDGHIQKCIPDYLTAIMEQGVKPALDAHRRLEKALFTYDLAQIFTIHGFCFRMLQTYALEGQIFCSPTSAENSSSINGLLLQAIRDFLRTEIHTEKFSPGQLHILLKSEKKEIRRLEQSLLREISRGVPISPPPSFTDQFKQFQLCMSEMQEQYRFNGKCILEDFFAKAPAYTQLADRQKRIYPEYVQKMKAFAALFDKTTLEICDFDLLVEDGIILLTLFDDSRLAKKSTIIPHVHYPNLNLVLKSCLKPLIDQAHNPKVLFTRLAADCQLFLKNYQMQEELIGHQDLLQQMLEAVKHKNFASQVINTYRAAIVDEFQDTDPIQWEIFSSLFAGPQDQNCLLYLVGDPKQSIYAFRQADIYTYLAATKKLGAGSIFSLDTNFRSQPDLVHALNTLFSSVAELFPLPKSSAHLSYKNVHAGRLEEKTFTDRAACFQFWMVKEEHSFPLKVLEESIIFPSLAEELIALHTNDRIELSKCAILVSDRYQGARISEYLKLRGIKTKNQKATNLAKTEALKSMKEILYGILHYREEQSLQIALCGRLIKKSELELLELQSHECKANAVLSTCARLKNSLCEGGFGQFFSHLMQSVWHDDQRSLLEHLLEQEEGYSFYCAWQEIAALLIEEQAKNALAPEKLLDFLDTFDDLAQEDDPRMKAFIDAEDDAVMILTTHVSKGLEFDIVFALGMITRPKSPEDSLLLSSQNERLCLKAITSTDDPEYQQLCQEIDAEKLRQLYVALTRGRYRVYLPVVIPLKEMNIQPGCASPADLLLAKIDQPETDPLTLYKRVNKQNGKFLQEFIDKHAQTASLSLKILKADQTARRPDRHKNETLLLPPPSVAIAASPSYVQSFTSLHKLIGANREKKPVEMLNSTGLNAHTLPLGTDTGIIIHKILENIPFHLGTGYDNQQTLRSKVLKSVQDTPYAEWEGVISDMIINTLTTPLIGQSFCLADLDENKMYRECEFTYPSHKNYLKGTIDLIFEHEGEYYLVDWKTNWLGDSTEEYHTQAMEEAVKINHYDVQAGIYAEALQRYLTLFYNQPKRCNGVYYLFIRGIGPGTGMWRQNIC